MVISPFLTRHENLLLYNINTDCDYFNAYYYYLLCVFVCKIRQPSYQCSAVTTLPLYVVF